MPCSESEDGAQSQSWENVEDKSVLPYRALLFGDVSTSIGLARPTVDAH